MAKSLLAIDGSAATRKIIAKTVRKAGLPGMGGRDFVKKTRENEANANIDDSIAKLTLLYRTSKNR